MGKLGLAPAGQSKVTKIKIFNAVSVKSSFRVCGQTKTLPKS